jgi:hypothetical protein
MSRRDTFRAERTWALLVVWLSLLILTNLSPAPAAAAAVSPGEFHPAAPNVLQAAGSLARTTLDDLPREDAECPASPASVDETEQQRQADTTSSQACLPSGGISHSRPFATGRAPDDAPLPACWISYGIRDLRGPPRA